MSNETENGSPQEKMNVAEKNERDVTLNLDQVRTLLFAVLYVADQTHFNESLKRQLIDLKEMLTLLEGRLNEGGSDVVPERVEETSQA